MKHLIIAILIIPLLGMVPPDDGPKELKVVEHYILRFLIPKTKTLKMYFL